MNDGREAGCKVCVSICENLFLVQDYEVPVSFDIFLSQKDNTKHHGMNGREWPVAKWQKVAADEMRTARAGFAR